MIECIEGQIKKWIKQWKWMKTMKISESEIGRWKDPFVKTIQCNEVQVLFSLALMLYLL
jgi:hypothetical protein